MARLLVFARAPVAGRVKTRLAPALGASGAARLHAAFVRHTLEQAAAARPYELQLWGAGADPGGFLAATAGATGATLAWQSGADLGARMAHALASATADGRPAVIVGTDCPWLDAGSLATALARLAHRDAVLGPATDGGYVLLGLHRVAPGLFTDVAWGTDAVLATTRARMAQAGWRWHELPPRPDVDRPDDLSAVGRLGRRWAALACPGRAATAGLRP